MGQPPPQPIARNNVTDVTKLIFDGAADTYYVGQQVKLGYSKTFSPAGQMFPTGFQVSPDLPPGLSLDPKTGVLYGYPKETAPKRTYTVSAPKAKPPVTAQLTFEIKDDGRVRGFDYLPSDVMGLPNFALVVAAPDLDKAVSDNVESGFTTSPKLPEGIKIDPRTGEISGMATTLSPKQEYTVHLETLDAIYESKILLSINVASGLKAGASRACAILDDQSIACWGLSPENGQTQNALQNTPHNTPIRLNPIRREKTILSASVSHNHLCVAEKDGELLCWGDGYDAESLPYSEDHQPFPIESSADLVATATQINCASFTNGEIKCWTNRKTPPEKVAVTGKKIQALAAAGSKACAVADGTVSCWDENKPATLSNPDRIDSLGNNVKDVQMSESHSCALLGDGSVRCWGENAMGQLGSGNNAPTQTPVAVLGLKARAKAIAVGSQFSCAVLESRSVQCWGKNNHGQLGSHSLDFCQISDKKKKCSFTPNDVQSLTGPATATAIAAGADFACAVVGGRVFCWGANSHGTLGDGSTGTASVTPVLVGPWR